MTKEVHKFEAPYDERFRDHMIATTEHSINCGFRVIDAPVGRPALFVNLPEIEQVSHHLPTWLILGLHDAGGFSLERIASPYRRDPKRLIF